MSLAATTPCGWCGDKNPNAAVKCASCEQPFGLYAANPDALFGPDGNAERSTPVPEQSTPWVALRPPAKLGPLTLHENGVCTGPDNLAFHATASFVNLKVSDASISLIDGLLTVIAPGAGELKARFSDGLWSQYMPVIGNSPLPDGASSSRVAFPGVSFIDLSNQFAFSQQFSPVQIHRNGRSLEQFAFQLITAIRESNLPVLVAWDGFYTGGSNMFGLVCRKRFMGTSWTVIRIRCNTLGDWFSIEMRSGLGEFVENKKELRRLRKGYWPILGWWLLYISIYIGAMQLLRLYLSQSDVVARIEQFTGQPMKVWEPARNIGFLIAAIWAYLGFKNKIDSKLVRLHFTTINLSDPRDFGDAQFAFGLSSRFPLFYFFLLSIGVFVFFIIPRMTGGLDSSSQQIPKALLPFMVAPPEFYLFLPRTLYLLWNAFFGKGVGRPITPTINMQPNSTISTSLPQALGRVITSLQ